MSNITPEYAHELRKLVWEYRTGVNKNLWLLAQTLKEIRDKKIYKLLDCSSFNEFIASPEIGLSRSAVYALIRRFELYSVRLQIPEATLISIDHSKLDIIAPVVEKDPARWIGEAANLSSRDLINETRQEQGREEMKVLATPPEDGAVEPAPSSYLAYVRKQACCACGRSGAVYAHFPRHERPGGKFGIPLCHECHDRYHHGEKDWTWENRLGWGKYLEDLVELMFK